MQTRRGWKLLFFFEKNKINNLQTKLEYTNGFHVSKIDVLDGNLNKAYELHAEMFTPNSHRHWSKNSQILWHRNETMILKCHSAFTRMKIVDNRRRREPSQRK